MRQSTRQVVAYPASPSESSTPANLLLSPADLLVRIRSQDQTGGASPAPSLPPKSHLSIGTTFPYFAPFSAPRALNLLIPRVTFGRCVASYVSRRSTHLASTNSTTCLFVSHLADLLSRGFPTPVHIPGRFFSLCFLSFRSEGKEIELSRSGDVVFLRHIVRQIPD